MTACARGDPRGQSLAEFAIVIPVFLLLVLALFDVGRYVVAQNALANAAREGARLAVVNQDAAAIEAQVRNVAFLANPVVATPIFLRVAPDVNDANLDDNLLCATGDLDVGCVAVIRASASLTPITPIASGLIGTITLNATSMLPVEFVCPNPDLAAFSTVESCPKQQP